MEFNDDLDENAIQDELNDGDIEEIIEENPDDIGKLDDGFNAPEEEKEFAIDGDVDIPGLPGLGFEDNDFLDEGLGQIDSSTQPVQSSPGWTVADVGMYAAAAVVIFYVGKNVKKMFSTAQNNTS